jgi:hypothetical protein
VLQVGRINTEIWYSFLNFDKVDQAERDVEREAALPMKALAYRTPRFGEVRRFGHIRRFMPAPCDNFVDSRTIDLPSRRWAWRTSADKAIESKLDGPALAHPLLGGNGHAY